MQCYQYMFCCIITVSTCTVRTNIRKREVLIWYFKVYWTWYFRLRHWKPLCSSAYFVNLDLGYSSETAAHRWGWRWQHLFLKAVPLQFQVRTHLSMKRARACKPSGLTHGYIQCSCSRAVPGLEEPKRPLLILCLYWGTDLRKYFTYAQSFFLSSLNKLDTG